MMLEKRYLHRNDWSRITSRRYSQKWVEEQDFTGYIALTEIHEITTPFVKTMGGKNVCIIDKNYTRLQQLPMDANYVITTTFNDKGQVVQWYIDITNCNGVDQGEPYMEDLFLDIIVLPTGEVITKDEDELQQALENNWITKEQYDLAYTTFYWVIKELKQGTFELLTSSSKYREVLL
ncbi:DUF402 domain-containing protein [Solibacillus sp. FSL H8-0523]|uniref:DUF402 domain-containing protein n=1 Tax=Solibacillus sp. FSL H8-0523 TaxID=2954511 RepID=UPI003100BD06